MQRNRHLHGLTSFGEVERTKVERQVSLANRDDRVDVVGLTDGQVHNVDAVQTTLCTSDQSIIIYICFCTYNFSAIQLLQRVAVASRDVLLMDVQRGKNLQHQRDGAVATIRIRHWDGVGVGYRVVNASNRIDLTFIDGGVDGVVCGVVRATRGEIGLHEIGLAIGFHSEGVVSVGGETGKVASPVVTILGEVGDRRAVQLSHKRGSHAAPSGLSGSDIRRSRQGFYFSTNFLIQAESSLRGRCIAAEQRTRCIILHGVSSVCTLSHNAGRATRNSNQPSSIVAFAGLSFQLIATI